MLSNSFFKKNMQTNSGLNNLVLGFKIHISGRLSRRDRASDIWHVFGSVPANKFSANVDYGFYTVGLLNSAVRIKVWIHRKAGLISPSWYVKAL
jgi:ribosomal protein S3